MINSQPIYIANNQSVQYHKRLSEEMKIIYPQSSQHKPKTDMALSRKDILRSILSDGVNTSTCTGNPQVS